MNGREADVVKQSKTFDFVVRIALVMSLALPSSLSLAADKPDKLAARPAQVRGDEITPKQQESVRKGLAWLAAHQQRDGARRPRERRAPEEIPVGERAESRPRRPSRRFASRSPDSPTTTRRDSVAADSFHATTVWVRGGTLSSR